MTWSDHGGSVGSLLASGFAGAVGRPVEQGGLPDPREQGERLRPADGASSPEAQFMIQMELAGQLTTLSIT